MTESIARLAASTRDDEATASLAERLATAERKIAALSAELSEVRRELPANSAALCLVSGEFEKVLTVLMLAHMAASMEMEVTIFFAFWGVQAVKRSSRFRGKPSMEKALTAMLKADIRGLESSKFNFAGLGPVIFQKLMKDKGIATPAELLASAREVGIRLHACTTSMEVFGVAQDELLPEVTCCGAAQYLELASRSKVGLIL